MGIFRIRQRTRADAPIMRERVWNRAFLRPGRHIMQFGRLTRRKPHFRPRISRKSPARPSTEEAPNPQIGFRGMRVRHGPIDRVSRSTRGLRNRLQPSNMLCSRHPRGSAACPDDSRQGSRASTKRRLDNQRTIFEFGTTPYFATIRVRTPWRVAGSESGYSHLGRT